MNKTKQETFTRKDIESSLKKEFPNLSKSEISKAIDAILEQNMIPKVLQLPSKEDPSSFVQKHTKEFIYEHIKKHTIDFLQFSLIQSN